MPSLATKCMELVIDAASGRSELSLLRLSESESLLMPLRLRLQAGTPQDTTRATVTVPLSVKG